ncbi:transposase [Flavobacterium pectinovorum]|uniref:Transposase IS200-like domain-containing protein n=1 Tax=Flavobacterium pectinovorum TaxID=29533 RepID=A0A502F7P4_9FLAO|nr:transposase [Flavobacterium pectinovorum]TPG45379.1 hypothetical protein EAH81_01905 [Flavobacterium pectinovorum]
MTLFKEKYKIGSNRLKNWDYSSEAVYFITLVTKNRDCIFGSIEEDKMILNENGKTIETELLKSIKIRENWFFHNWVVMPNHIHLLIEIMEPRFKNKQIVDKQNLGMQIPHMEIGDNQIGDKQIFGMQIPRTEIDDIQIDDMQFPHTQIVETHSSASASGISTNNEVNDLTNIGETHCCASLRDNWGDNRDDNYGSNLNDNCGTNRGDNCVNINENRNRNNKNQDQLDSILLRKPNSISSFVATFKSVTTRQINGVETIWQSNYHDHIVRNYKKFDIIYNYIKTNPRAWELDSMKP